MEKFRQWWSEKRREFAVIRQYWPPVLCAAFLASLLPWAELFAIGSVATGISLGVACMRGDDVNINDFFPPYFLYGLGITLIIIFIYQIIKELAVSAYKNARELAKYDIKNIELDVCHPPENSSARAGFFVRHSIGEPISFDSTIEKMYLGRDEFAEFNGFSIPRDPPIFDDGKAWEWELRDRTTVNKDKTAYVRIVGENRDRMPISESQEFTVHVAMRFTVNRVRLVPHERLIVRLTNKNGNLIIEKVSDWNEP